MMKYLRVRIFFAIIGLLWLVYGYVLYGQTPLSPIFTTTILATVAGILYTVAVYTGPSKPTAIFGKILIVAGVISVVVLLLDRGISASVDLITRLLVIVSGLLLERLSPHQRLFNWMFLMIATKVEAVLIAALISQASPAVPALFSMNVWWILVVLMLLGVPLLVFQKKSLYRISVLLTSLVSLVVVFDFLTTQADLQSTAVYLAISASLWPFITQRLIGYRVFYSQKS